MSDTTQTHTIEQIRLALIRASENRSLGEAFALDELWADFFEQYDRILRGFARRTRCPLRSTDDIVCAVWRDVLRLLPQFEYDPARGGFRRWLYRIVQHKAIEEARQRGRNREVSIDEQTTRFWCQVIDPRSTDRDDPLTTLYRQELAHSIMKTFKENAATNQQEVVQRFFFGGQDHETIAREMGLTAQHVRQLKRRALVEIKIIAAKHFGTDPLS